MNWFEIIMVVLTGIYVGFTAFYAIVSYKMFDKISEQTGHAEASAKAALLNAKAVINAERAWLLIEMVKNPFNVPHGEPDQETPRNVHCVVMTKNFGNTPAKIYFGKFGLFSGNSRYMPPFGSNGSQNIFVPNPVLWDNPDVVAPQTGRNYEVILDMSNISPEEGTVLWVCGMLKYDDVFSGEPRGQHETRFCFFYDIDTKARIGNWTVAGPSEYNQAT